MVVLYEVIGSVRENSGAFLGRISLVLLILYQRHDEIWMIDMAVFREKMEQFKIQYYCMRDVWLWQLGSTLRGSTNLSS